MPIVADDIDIYLSGGAANSDPNLSIGGAKSATELVDASLHNLFDIVGSQEANDGDVEYRCVYVQNNHGTLTLLNAKFFIKTITPSDDTAIALALAGEGKNGTAETPADEDSAPAGESFSSPTTKAAGLDLGDLAPGDYFPVWIRRTVNAAAAAFNDSVVLSVEGDTGA